MAVEMKQRSIHGACRGEGSASLRPSPSHRPPGLAEDARDTPPRPHKVYQQGAEFRLHGRYAAQVLAAQADPNTGYVEETI